MATYYDFLQINPAAAPAEVEAACESQYNQWRRLVTHHNPEVVQKANEALRLVEKIRATLTDPQKRSIYDASLNNGAIGGLADPMAQAPSKPAAPPLPPPPAKPALVIVSSPVIPVGERVDAWLCPKCQTVNTIGSRHCSQCGYQLGLNCPDCQALILAAVPFCSVCGTNVALAQQRVREREEANRRQQEEQRIQAQRQHEEFLIQGQRLLAEREEQARAIDLQQRHHRIQDLQAKIRAEQVQINEVIRVGSRFFVPPWSKDFRLFQDINRSDNGCGYQILAPLLLIGIPTVSLIVGGWNVASLVPAVIVAAILDFVLAWLNRKSKAKWRAESYAVRISRLNQEIKMIQSGEFLY